MNIISKLSSNTTNFVGNYCKLNNNELEKVKYGIELLFMNIYKTIIILILAHLLGILLQTFLFIFAYNLVRMYAFGMHAKTGISCLTWSIILFLGLTYISPHVQLTGFYINLIFVYNITSAILYAPADTEKRPLINPYKRKVLKIKTIICLTFLYLLAIFYCNSTCANIITFGSLVACIMINPLIYKLSGQQYNNYRFSQKKEA